MQNFCLSDVLLERFQSATNELGYTEQIVELDCLKLDTWMFRDRKPFELGNIDELASSIKHIGQCQPIIVVKTSEVFRPKEDHSAEYIVIAGYRRWIACKKYNLQVKAVIKNVSFEQAVGILVSENEKENVSDYSKGMFYHSLISNESTTAEELCKSLNIAPSQLKLYLSFAQVPAEIWGAVGDLSRVSAKTAQAILQIVNKGTMYVEALMSIANKIAHGYGEKRVIKTIEKIIDKKLNRKPQQKVIQSKLKFNGKTVMSLSQGKIKIDDSIVNHDKYSELVQKIERSINDFASFYLTKK
jgi:ParB family chromosome partitioning protein